MISARTTVAISVLAVAAIGSWFLARPDRDNDAGAPSYDASHRGYYLKSARILGTGSDGSLLYEIEAEHVDQEGDDRVLLTDVRINYSPQSDVPWTVNADTATISQYEQRVLLRGHVRAVSHEGFSASETEIRTQYLELDPENFLAETDQRVQIRIGERSLTATGMLASLKENRLELKSNVSGKFVP